MLVYQRVSHSKCIQISCFIVFPTAHGKTRCTMKANIHSSAPSSNIAASFRRHGSRWKAATWCARRATSSSSPWRGGGLADPKTGRLTWWNQMKNRYIIWVNYNNSLTWIKAILGWFPLLTMTPVRSQWGRYNLPRYNVVLHQLCVCVVIIWRFDFFNYYLYTLW